MTLERSLLNRDLTNVETALEEAHDDLESMASITASEGGGDPFDTILIAMKRAQRELKRFRENWEKHENRS